VLEELGYSDNARDKDLQETLVDVSKALSSAVEILDGLLCFDKIESGILELHKQDVPVMAFLDECVQIFSPQARQSQVSLRLVTNASDSDGSRGAGNCNIAL
jgi:signal transduction histidine kinase